MDMISKPETAGLDTMFIVAGENSHCNLQNVLPKRHQHVSFPTRESNILDRVYSNVRGAYKAAPRPTVRPKDGPLLVAAAAWVVAVVLVLRGVPQAVFAWLEALSL